MKKNLCSRLYTDPTPERFKSPYHTSLDITSLYQLVFEVRQSIDLRQYCLSILIKPNKSYMNTERNN